MIHLVHCFVCNQNYDQRRDPKPERCGACGSNRVGVFTVEDNTLARSGCDRCECGCKYYEGDHCIDCGKHVLVGCDRPTVCFICLKDDSKETGVPVCQGCANTHPDDELIRRDYARRRA